MINYFKRNISLTIGLGLLIFLILFTLHGLLTVEFKQAYPLAVRPKQPPSLKYLFGTDFFGRDLYTAMVIGVWQTAIIGLLAGAAGTIIGIVWDSFLLTFQDWLIRPSSSSARSSPRFLPF